MQASSAHDDQDFTDAASGGWDGGMTCDSV